MARLRVYPLSRHGRSSCRKGSSIFRSKAHYYVATLSPGSTILVSNFCAFDNGCRFSRLSIHLFHSLSLSLSLLLFLFLSLSPSIFLGACFIVDRSKLKYLGHSCPDPSRPPLWIQVVALFGIARSFTFDRVRFRVDLSLSMCPNPEEISAASPSCWMTLAILERRSLEELIKIERRQGGGQACYREGRGEEGTGRG